MAKPDTGKILRTIHHRRMARSRLKWIAWYKTCEAILGIAFHLLTTWLLIRAVLYVVCHIKKDDIPPGFVREWTVGILGLIVCFIVGLLFYKDFSKRISQARRLSRSCPRS